MSEQEFGPAFDAPAVEVIGGREQTLPLLDLDELTEVGATVIGRKKNKALAKVPPDEHDRVRSVVDYYNGQEATVDDLIRYAGTPAGTLDVLTRSMVKAGVAKQDAKARALLLARQRGWAYATGLAMRVACLFGQPDPNANQGAAPGDAGDSESSELSTST